jgi:hypothetical protein
LRLLRAQLIPVRHDDDDFAPEFNHVKTLLQITHEDKVKILTKIRYENFNADSAPKKKATQKYLDRLIAEKPVDDSVL